MASKTLYRSRTDRMIGGVAAGLADYFDIDTTIVRVLFVISIFIGGGGIIAYIILWIVVPEKPVIFQASDNGFKNEQTNTEKSSTESGTEKNYSVNIDIETAINKAKHNKKVFIGVLLVILGGLFLLDNLIPRFDLGDYWPLILIGVGVAIIIKSTKN